MHRAIAAWLTERPWRAAIAAAFCGALALQMLVPFMVLAGAIPVLIALRFDSRQGVTVAGTAAFAAVWILLTVAHEVPWLIVAVVVVIAAPALLSLLLKRTGSLNLCFQLAVAGIAAVVVAIYATLADPSVIWVDLLRQLVHSMDAVGLHIAGDANSIIEVWARTMWGAVAALALATILGALFLGCWWRTLLNAPGQFGAEYRRLRLGGVLGVAVTLVFLASFLTDSPLVASLAWVGFVALSFQGLAAAHRSKAGGRLNQGWLAAIYVLLIMPLSTSITVVVLAIWGFADNWLKPRVAQS